MPDEGLAPEPLPDEPVLDDEDEDTARGRASVGELVAQDLADPDTPSNSERLAMEDLGDKPGETGHPGFRVATEEL